MKSWVFLASLLAGAIGLFDLTAGERPPQAMSDVTKKVNPLPEAKVERPLGTLERRCQKMLTMQIAVSDGTADLHKVIKGTADQKPRPKDKEVSLKLSEKEKALIVEVTKTLNMLKAERMAVAIIEVFQDLRADMKRVQRRLKIGNVGIDTQAIEQDVIDTLKDMIKALK
jgi:hypothetical protein